MRIRRAFSQAELTSTSCQVSAAYILPQGLPEALMQDADVARLIESQRRFAPRGREDVSSVVGTQMQASQRYGSDLPHGQTGSAEVGTPTSSTDTTYVILEGILRDFAVIEDHASVQRLTELEAVVRTLESLRNQQLSLLQSAHAQIQQLQIENRQLRESKAESQSGIVHERAQLAEQIKANQLALQTERAALNEAHEARMHELSMTVLLSGSRVVKHNRNGTIHDVVLRLTPDRSALAWSTMGRIASGERSIPLAGITDVVIGQTTEVFKKRTSIAPADELKRSLSVICAGRTLDIVLSSVEAHQLWAHGLNVLVMKNLRTVSDHMASRASLIPDSGTAQSTAPSSHSSMTSTVSVLQVGQ